MATVANMQVRVSANMSSFNRSLQTAQTSIKSFGKSVTSTGTKLSLGLTAPLALAGGKMIKLAMDAEETQNLFDVSLGSMSKSAENFTSTLSKNLGLNQYELKRQVATLNDMTKSMGLSETEAYNVATSMTELTQDLASFKNLDIEEAFNKIRSGLSGESEPLKRIGVLVNDNTIKTWAYTHGLAREGEALSEKQKVLARVGALMEQTKDAQGDLARTADSATNMWRRMKSMAEQIGVELGNVMLPIFSKVVGKVLELITSFGNLSTKQKEFAVYVAVFVASIGPMLVIIGNLVTLFGTLLSPIGLVAIAIAGLVEYFIGWNNVIETAKTVIGGIIRSLILLKDGLPTASLIEFRRMLMDVFGRETGQIILTNLLNIKNNVSKVFEIIQKVFAIALDNISVFLDATLENMLKFWKTHGDEITESAMNMLDSIARLYVFVYEGISRFLVSTLDNILKFWEKHGETLGQTIANMLTFVLDTFTWVFNSIASLISDKLQIIMDYWDTHGESLTKAVTNILKAVLGIFLWIFGGIITFISEHLDTFNTIFDLGLDSLLQLLNIFAGIFTGDWDLVWESIKNIWDNFMGDGGILESLFWLFVDAMATVGGALHTALTTAFKVMFEAVFGIIKSIWGNIVDYMLGKVEWVMKKVDAVKEAIASIVNAKIEVPKSTINGRTRNQITRRDRTRKHVDIHGNVTYSEYAKGGIITSPTLALMGEGGESEAIIPLSKLDQYGGGGQQIIQVIMDGEVVSEKVTNKQGNKLLRMRGAY